MRYLLDADTNVIYVNDRSTSVRDRLQGDSINIQGNKIYLGQDLSEFSSQI